MTGWMVVLFEGLSLGLSIYALIALRVDPAPKKRHATKLPSPQASAGPMTLAVWEGYERGSISLISALFRIEELFAARVAEIVDWDVVDWTTSSLEPTRGRWEWDGDKLVPQRVVPEGHPSGMGSIYTPGGMSTSVALGPVPMSCTSQTVTCMSQTVLAIRRGVEASAPYIETLRTKKRARTAGAAGGDCTPMEIERRIEAWCNGIRSHWLREHPGCSLADLERARQDYVLGR